jgi:hypothetical protein
MIKFKKKTQNFYKRNNDEIRNESDPQNMSLTCLSDLSKHEADMFSRPKAPGLGLRQVKSVWIWRSTRSKVK